MVVISIITTGVGMMSIVGFVNDHSDSTSQTVAQESASASTGVQKNQQPNTHIFAMGDIMLGRYVETLIEKNGPGYPFEDVRDMLRGYDMVIANLEGPVVDDAPQTPNGSLQFSFPTTAMDVLRPCHPRIAGKQPYFELRKKRVRRNCGTAQECRHRPIWRPIRN